MSLQTLRGDSLSLEEDFGPYTQTVVLWIGLNRLQRLYGFLSTKYKPIDGIHRKAYIFSAEAVVEWNERHGFTNTVAHSAIQS